MRYFHRKLWVTLLFAIRNCVIFRIILLLADPPGVTRVKEIKKWIMKPTVHFLYVPADLKVYYQYSLIDKKGGWGLMRLWK